MTRTVALAQLLEPIIWPPSSSIEYRKRIVSEKRANVKLVFPFLSAEEKRLASYWLTTQAHGDLWR